VTGQPRLARAAFGAGLLLFGASQIAGLGRALKREGSLPGLAQDSLRESRAALDRGERSRAAGELRAAGAIHRYNIDMLLRITESQARAGDVVGGRQTLESAERLAPGAPELQTGLGWILLAEQRGAEAEAAFRRAAEARPRNAWVLAGLGEVLLERDHFGEAIDVFGRSLAIEPDETSVRASLGIAYALSGRPEKAVVEFAAVIQASPDPRMLDNLRRAEAAVRDAALARKEKLP
jgi:Flp pilus assembly protein TadD